MGSSHQAADPDDPQWMATSLCIEPFSDDDAQRQCQFTQIFKQPTEIKPFFLLSYLSQWKIQINPISQQNDQISKQAPGTDGRLGPWELLFPAAENWVHLTVPWLARVLNKPFIAATTTSVLVRGGIMFHQDNILWLKFSILLINTDTHTHTHHTRTCPEEFIIWLFRQVNKDNTKFWIPVQWYGDRNTGLEISLWCWNEDCSTQANIATTAPHMDTKPTHHLCPLVMLGVPDGEVPRCQWEHHFPLLAWL